MKQRILGVHSMGNDAMQLFEDQPIRSAWDAEREEWYFSIIDVVRALTGSENPRRYWSDLKRKLKSEGAAQLYENIVQLKLKSPDGKKRLTDVADTEQLLRIIQSYPRRRPSRSSSGWRRSPRAHRGDDRP